MRIHRRVGALALGILAATTITFVALASERSYDSAIVGEEVLLAHGVELRGPSILAAAPNLEALEARSIADSVMARPIGTASEVFRITTPFAPGNHSPSCWLILYAAGHGPPSFGPPDASKATFATEYSGVLIDDLTGEVIYSFEGGSFSR
jgi:hypothetical protein